MHAHLAHARPSTSFRASTFPLLRGSYENVTSPQGMPQNRNIAQGHVARNCPDFRAGRHSYVVENVTSPQGMSQNRNIAQGHVAGNSSIAHGHAAESTVHAEENLIRKSKYSTLESSCLSTHGHTNGMTSQRDRTDLTNTGQPTKMTNDDDDDHVLPSSQFHLATPGTSANGLADDAQQAHQHASRSCSLHIAGARQNTAPKPFRTRVSPREDMALKQETKI